MPGAVQVSKGERSVSTVAIKDDRMPTPWGVPSKMVF